jgi:hypothetical protein
MITLYHGTSARHLPSILKSGLQPRKVHGNSNWEGDIQSKADFVYLTDAYPVYFALAAAEIGEDLAVIRVEVDERILFPDEDYVALCLKTHDRFYKNIPITEINAMIDLYNYRQFWVESLKYNGKAAIPFVRPEAITGHVVIDSDDMQTILATGGDSVPMPLPYQLLGEKYRQILEEMFRSSPKQAGLMSRKIGFWRYEIP